MEDAYIYNYKIKGGKNMPISKEEFEKGTEPKERSVGHVKARVIGHLLEHRDQAFTVFELRDALNTRPQQIYPVVNKLVDEGYLEKRAVGTSRAYYVQLTDAGVDHFTSEDEGLAETADEEA